MGYTWYTSRLHTNTGKGGTKCHDSLVKDRWYAASHPNDDLSPTTSCPQSSIERSLVHLISPRRKVLISDNLITWGWTEYCTSSLFLADPTPPPCTCPTLRDPETSSSHHCALPRADSSSSSSSSSLSNKHAGNLSYPLHPPSFTPVMNSSTSHLTSRQRMILWEKFPQHVALRNTLGKTPGGDNFKEMRITVKQAISPKRLSFKEEEITQISRSMMAPTSNVITRQVRWSFFTFNLWPGRTCDEKIGHNTRRDEEKLLTHSNLLRDKQTPFDVPAIRTDKTLAYL